MTQTEREILDKLLELDKAVGQMVPARPSRFAAIFARLDELASQLPSDAPRDLQHYLSAKVPESPCLPRGTISTGVGGYDRRHRDSAGPGGDCHDPAFRPPILAIADASFQPAGQFLKPSAAPTHTMPFRARRPAGPVVDEALVSVMRAPRTFTREDVVEITCHGGLLAAKLVLDTVLENGARLAAPGEFTRRAFLNGRIDLTQRKRWPT